MTNDLFYKEVLESDCCPENFDKIYREFSIYQTVTSDILKEFSRVCKEYNIGYQLAFGSLLGAIRDGGQIPWDYDIDVFVKYTDKDKLIYALQAGLGRDYYFSSPEIDDKCIQTFVRVGKKGWDVDYIHVDVFYLYGITGDEQIRHDIQEKIYRIQWDRYYKNVSIKKERHKGIKRRLVLHREKACRLLKSAKKDYDELCQILDDSCAGVCDFYADTSKAYKGLFYNKDILSVIPVDLAIGSHYIPKEYKQILTTIYGDYMSYPPIEKRVKELLTHYNMIHNNLQKEL